MVTITLNEKEYELRLGFKAVIALENHFNERNLKKLFSVHIGESLSGLTAVIWAAMKHEHKKITMSKVEDLLDQALENEEITLDQLNEIVEKVVDNSKLFNNEDNVEADDDNKKK